MPHRFCDGVIMVYSVTDKASFEAVKLHYDRIRIAKGKKFFPTILVGNKADTHPDQRLVSRDEGQALALEWKCGFYETSTKTGTNVVVCHSFGDLHRVVKPFSDLLSRKSSSTWSAPSKLTSLLAPFLSRHLSKSKAQPSLNYFLAHQKRNIPRLSRKTRSPSRQRKTRTAQKANEARMKRRGIA